MIKVGDKVKIKALNSEKYLCSVLGWDDAMLDLIGKVYAVESVLEFEGTETIIVRDGYFSWYFFPEDLENLDDESAKAFDFMVNSLT